MHVDAFFEYLREQNHVYWAQIPTQDDPVPEERDGVPNEEDRSEERRVGKECPV